MLLNKQFLQVAMSLDYQISSKTFMPIRFRIHNKKSTIPFALSSGRL